MNSHTLRSMALAAALGVVVCGLAVRSAGAQPNAKVAKNDPCKLVTQDEIKAALQAKRDESHETQKVALSITSMKSVTRGEARICEIQWEATAGGKMQEKGELNVNVFDAEYFKSEVSDLNRKRSRTSRPKLSQIPELLPNEAYFFGYSDKGNPEVLIGDVAVGVEFLKGKPSVDLLRAAVKRVVH